MKKRFTLILLVIFTFALSTEAKRAVTAEDMFALKDVGETRISPDGVNVVYTLSWTDRAKNRSYTNLYLVPSRGGEPSVQLTTGEFNDTSPRWSPDGKKIAFMSNRDGKAAIWVLDVITKQMRLLIETPTMFIHGELDNDVHITQAEEMYMGLRRRGIESVFVRYPREGHGLREPTHRLDQVTRTVAWFDKFLKSGTEESTSR